MGQQFSKGAAAPSTWSPNQDQMKRETEHGIMVDSEENWDKTLADGKAAMLNTQLTNKLAMGGAMGLLGGMSLAGLNWYLHNHPANQGKPSLLSPKPKHLIDEGCITHFVALAEYRHHNEKAYVNALQNADKLLGIQRDIYKYPDQITNAYTIGATSYLQGCKTNLLELIASLPSTSDKVKFLQISKKIEFYVDQQFAMVYSATATKRS